MDAACGRRDDELEEQANSVKICAGSCSSRRSRFVSRPGGRQFSLGSTNVRLRVLTWGQLTGTALGCVLGRLPLRCSWHVPHPCRYPALARALTQEANEDQRHPAASPRTSFFAPAPVWNPWAGLATAGSQIFSRLQNLNAPRATL
jgi:hypothetical protein